MKRPPRDWPQFEWYIAHTLDELATCYTRQKPQAGPKEFFTEIYQPVAQRDDGRVEEPADMLMLVASESDKLKGPDWLTKSPYGAIIVSCMFCVRAGAAFRAKNMELAWSYMADARYWAGVSMSSTSIRIAREQTIRTTTEKASAEALSEKARSGGTGRNMTYEPLRQYAYQLVTESERRPPTGWKSRAQAADEITKAIKRHCNAPGYSGPKLTEGKGALQTVERWLAGMPDASTHFPPRKTKSRED